MNARRDPARPSLPRAGGAGARGRRAGGTARVRSCGCSPSPTAAVRWNRSRSCRAARRSTRIGDALETVTQMAASVPVARYCRGQRWRRYRRHAGRGRAGAPGRQRHSRCTRWVSGRSRPTMIWSWSSCRLPAPAVAGATLRATVSIRHQRQPVHACASMTAASSSRRRTCRWAATPASPRANSGVPRGRGGHARPARRRGSARATRRISTNNERRAVVEVATGAARCSTSKASRAGNTSSSAAPSRRDRSLRLVSAVRATPNRYYRQGVTSAAELEKGFPRPRSTSSSATTR